MNEQAIIASIGVLFILFGYISYKQGIADKKAEEAQVAKQQLKNEVQEIKAGVKKTLDQQGESVTNYAVLAVQLSNLNESQKEIQASIKFLIQLLVKGQEGG